MNKKVLYLIFPLLILCAAILLFSNHASAPSNVNSEVRKDTSAEQASSFDKTLHSIDTPDSLWVIVNKLRPIVSSYTPNDLATTSIGNLLRADATNALNKLIDSARSNGLQLYIISGYRSYATQQAVYNSYAAKDGQAAADTYSARPGTSEHQTGWAADLGNGTCDLEICFKNTPAGTWLASHAHEFGFIIRYPEGKQTITGYQYEPWHIRYVGPELAAELHKTAQTMEEFFAVVPESQPY